MSTVGVRPNSGCVDCVPLSPEVVTEDSCWDLLMMLTVPVLAS